MNGRDRLVAFATERVVALPPPTTAQRTPVNDHIEPCPFCGEPASVIRRFGNEHTKSRGVEVGCAGFLKCGITKTVRVIRHDVVWAELKAIAAWNRRAK